MMEPMLDSPRNECVVPITDIQQGDWIGPSCVVARARHHVGGFGRSNAGSSTFELVSGGVLVFPHAFVTHLTLWHRGDR